ncbi:Putative CID domain, CTD kinase subunit gamma Ctk3 [Septoria linicola]|uniref:CID domain, CTD kinase subunit gamma Ctk3 n=1 Tax=Septoria linicola TaxID=215465 RepID=A0A9Q9EJ64_9PEZI|nr:Putative CID domain, CTD kinase subunit gamma Ctk3 [Septoria linicola]
MADPFEVRMRFTSQLQHLSASSSSATKAANYALRHSEYADDLHSCILEQLERNNINLRANIMYFLPALCDAAKHGLATGGLASEAGVYVRMLERDILSIVDLVAPDDGSGAANVKVVRKVLHALMGRGVLQSQTVRELEELMHGRDNLPGASSPVHDRQHSTHQHTPQGESEGEAAPASKAVRSTPQRGVPRHTHGSHGIRLDKRQIEQRIEEDRERHKRAREGIWAIPQQRGGDLAVDNEYEHVWEGGSDVDSDDYRMAEEETEERRKHLEYDDY